MSSMRQQFSEFIQGVFGFGKITKSTSSGDYDCDGEIGEATAPGCERWGDAAVLSRPPAGAEVAYVQLGDERIVLATRYGHTITVAEGEVVVRAMGAGSPAYVRLKPNGDVIVAGANIHLGAESVSTFVALAQKTDQEVARIWNLLAGLVAAPLVPPWNPTGTLADAGALKAAAAAVRSAVVIESTAATKTRAQ